MNRGFLTWFRGGSTLLYSLIQHPGTTDLISWNRQPLVPTSFIVEDLDKDSETCYAIRIGDLAHEDSIPRNPETLGNKLKSVLLVRDGRNQIESQRNHKGSIDCERSVMNPKEWFEQACTGFKHRANYAARWAQLPNVKLYKMENFILQPYNSVLSMFSFLELTVLKKVLAENVFAFCDEQKIVAKQSSFGETEKVNERWASWTDWELETFDRIAGKELRRLGYQ